MMSLHGNSSQTSVNVYVFFRHSKPKICHNVHAIDTTVEDECSILKSELVEFMTDRSYMTTLCFCSRGRTDSYLEHNVF